MVVVAIFLSLSCIRMTLRQPIKISVAQGVAIAFLKSDWHPVAQTRMANQLFRTKQPWLNDLAHRVIEEFTSPPSLADLEKFITTDDRFQLNVKSRNLKQLDRRRLLGDQPVASLHWLIPKIETLNELASWLDVSLKELTWLANFNSRFDDRLRAPQHYVMTAIKKRSKGIRLIESPKPKLKTVQRIINDSILSRVDPHPSAHGFCRGRSVISYVAPHVGSRFCMKFDLKDFFPRIRVSRVTGLFKMLGYDRPVRRHLAALCTNSVNQETIFCATGIPQIPSSESSRLYLPRHLPQGAPTSPAIANLIAFRLDARLHGLAKSAKATYSRYADDLLFSGGQELERSAKRFETTVGAIAIEEGFEVNFRKTRLMRASQKQSATGIVFNERINIDRREFDRLKAILHNCNRAGAESQNRESHPDFRAHLLGRIQWVTLLNETRGQKLRHLFDQIEW